MEDCGLIENINTPPADRTDTLLGTISVFSSASYPASLSNISAGRRTNVLINLVILSVAAGSVGCVGGGGGGHSFFMFMKNVRSSIRVLAEGFVGTSVRIFSNQTKQTLTVSH